MAVSNRTRSKQPGKEIAEAKLTSAYNNAPRSEHYEFGGIPGTIGIVVAVTYFSYFFALACNGEGCPPSPWTHYLARGFESMQHLSFYQELWDQEAMLVYLAWFGYCVVCWAILPAQWIDGVKLRDGTTRLKYKINAFSTLLVTTVLAGATFFVRGPKPFLFISDHWVGLVTAAWIFSTVQSFYVYAASFKKDAMLAEGGNTGNVWYDWFIGRQLNPQIGSFDLKSFNELRPGLILWFVIDLAMAAKQYNDIGRVTDAMALVVVFHSIYIFDACFNEPAIFTTMDIVTDGFGWMLSAGDLLWVPFTYSLQARYLALHPHDLGVLGTLGVIATQTLGYWIFRSSNGEKNDFRNGKNPKTDLKTMKTKRGTELLVSGWWGWSRHPNYLGDWTMAWAWCLPTGFFAPLTFFYVVYFAVLLVHRQMRDDHACKIKYGSDWEKYCKLVPSRIIPYLY